jgi:hypothetical protein
MTHRALSTLDLKAAASRKPCLPWNYAGIAVANLRAHKPKITNLIKEENHNGYQG